MQKLEAGALIQHRWDVKWRGHVGKSLQLLLWVSLPLPYPPAVPLLRVNAREMKTYVHTKPCARMLIAASVTVAKRWNQSKYFQLVNG